MPKIIENLRNQLIEEARRQINMFGYEKTTIRSVAAECGIATGTVYNYFKSKDIPVFRRSTMIFPTLIRI